MALAAPGDAPTDWLPAAVPGTAAGTLRTAGRWSLDDDRDFDGMDAWWRLDFEASPGRAVLGFDGLATLAEVWLDGEHILDSRNMFRAGRVEVELTGSRHELRIRCRALTPELKQKRPRPRWRVPMLVEQQLRWFRTTLLGRTPGWSPPCAPVGPWQPVWIEQAPPRVDEPRISARLDGNTGVLRFTARVDTALDDARLVLTRGATRHATPLQRHGEQARAELRIEAPDRWWPHTHGEPALYDIAVEARKDNEDVRIDLGRAGFRDIVIDRQDGDFAVRVNGVMVFCRGACWTPLDPVTLRAPADAVNAAVRQMVDAGMNMLRVGGAMTYAADDLLNALDAHGVLLWHDLMFANMDYPEDDAFLADALNEVEEQLARLAPHPCLAVVCGNSEVEQQAAMAGAARELWAPALFHHHIPPLVAATGCAYLPSSAHDGAFPHAVNAGPTSYYGVGAYRRTLDDSRRCGLRFASECLALANVPADAALPGGAATRVHHPLWKRRAPRDLGAGWDFDDVRDHYTQRLFNVDVAALRASDHARHLALARATSAELMTHCFSEWRRAGSTTRGALVWFLRDLWQGAGWGVIDADGRPKSCWYALKRALAPRALLITDEGLNGLLIHIANDRPGTLEAQVSADLWRDGTIHCGHGEHALAVPAHTTVAVPATTLFDGFIDLSFAYRFGPPVADVVHARLAAGTETIAEAFFLPAGMPVREADVGLDARVEAVDAQTCRLHLESVRFAHSVSIDAPGWLPDDDAFHLAPGQQRTLTLHATATRRAGRVRGSVSALNSARAARFDLP